SAYPSLLVHQRQRATMRVSARRVLVFQRAHHVLPGDTEYTVLIAGYEIPAGCPRVQPLRVVSEHFYRIVPGIDSMRQNRHVRAILIDFIHFEQVLFHDRTYGRTTGKKEVGDIYFTLKSSGGHRLPILIRKAEVRYLVIKRINDGPTIHFFLNRYPRPHNRERFFGLLTTKQSHQQVY